MSGATKKGSTSFALLACVILFCGHAQGSGNPTHWKMHVIDRSSKGADGVKLGDFNKDGLPDIAVGWEQGNNTRMYVNPGHARAKELWPSVSVGVTRTVEDAFFADLDSDGILDIVSLCEGSSDEGQRVLIHWGPRSDELKSASWKQVVIPDSVNRMKYLQGAGVQLDGKHGLDVVVAGKRGGAELGWFEAPQKARSAHYTYHHVAGVDWVMSLLVRDMNGDGLQDFLISDRKFKKGLGGVVWFKNPGPAGALHEPWERHTVLPISSVTFIDVADMDRDGLDDLICPSKDGIKILKRLDGTGDHWKVTSVPTGYIEDSPKSLVGKPKGVKAGDMNADGKLDICMTCEGARGDLPGVVWYEQTGETPFSSSAWQMHSISGPPGVKFDRIELYDFDNDGDLDLLTTEEISGLGVIWYENPSKNTAHVR